MTTATKLTQEQMLRQAERDFENLDRQQLENAAKIKASEAELATLESRKESRAALLTTLEETAKHRRAQHAELTQQARLAEGTLQTGHFIHKVNAAAKELKHAEKNLAIADEQARRDNEQDFSRLLICNAERATASQRIEDIREQRIALLAVVARIREEQGQAEFRDIVLTIELAKAEAENKKQADEDAIALLDSTVRDGIARLKNWPELAEKVRQMVPYEDDATAMMQQAIRYLDTLAERLHSIPSNILGDHLGEPEIRYSDVLHLLQVTDVGRGDEPRLREQSRKMRLFLAAYRRAKREK